MNEIVRSRTGSASVTARPRLPTDPPDAADDRCNEDQCVATAPDERVFNGFKTRKESEDAKSRCSEVCKSEEDSKIAIHVMGDWRHGS